MYSLTLRARSTVDFGVLVTWCLVGQALWMLGLQLLHPTHEDLPSACAMNLAVAASEGVSSSYSHGNRSILQLQESDSAQQERGCVCPQPDIWSGAL